MVLTNPINSSVKITLFESSGTFTKDRRTMYAIVWGIGGGGGGANGRRGAAGTDRAGGGGGSCQGVFYYFIPTTCLGNTESVTVGGGGNFGAILTTDDTNGNNGGNGGQTKFGNLMTYSSAGESKGGGGTTVNGVGGAQTTVITNFSYTLGASGGTGSTGDGVIAISLPLQTGGDHGYTQCFCPTGGGCGGGINSLNTVSWGGEAGSMYTCEATPTKILDAGWRGNANMNNSGRGKDGFDITSGGICCGSTGGGGGGSVDINTEVIGSNSNYFNKRGGGGGGGGAVLNTVGARSRGGYGATGFVQVIEFLA